MKLLYSDRIWWTSAEIMDELRLGKDLFRKLAAAGCFGAPFQPGGKNGKMWFHRERIERFVRDNMERTAKELELPSL